MSGVSTTFSKPLGTEVNNLNDNALQRIYSNYSATAKTHNLTLTNDCGVLIFVYYWGGSDNSKSGIYMAPMTSGTVTSAITTVKAANGVTLSLSARTLTIEVTNTFTSVVVVAI